MPGTKQPARDFPVELAAELAAALQRERLVPRFVDSYVVEHGRYALQTHATRYRELLALLTREALLAMTVRALEEAATAPKRKRFGSRRDAASAPAFRRKFLTAMARQQKWSAGDALDFQSDLRLYEELLERHPGATRTRKPFEAADHPFVDRCAILLDPSFIEQARTAASRTLIGAEQLAAAITAKVIDNSAD
jgi:hypothetical protein